MVRRRSVTGPSGSGRSRRVLRRSSGSVRRRISRLAAAMSAALIASKSMRCRRSCSETVSTASCTGGSSFGCSRRSRFCCIASATRREAGRRAFRLLLFLRLQQRHRRGLLRGGGVAPEQGEGLVEHLLVLVAVDHDRAQRGADFRLVAELDQRQRLLRGERLGRADRQPGAAEQAREVHDVGREGGGGESRGVQHGWILRSRGQQAKRPGRRLAIIRSWSRSNGRDTLRHAGAATDRNAVSPSMTAPR